MIGISAQLAGNDRSRIAEFALSMSNQFGFGITLLGGFTDPSFDVFSPIAISLGSYMDKAAGRRACTGKKITQDVSVLSR